MAECFFEGKCPQCGENDGVKYIEAKRYCVCHVCSNWWPLGDGEEPWRETRPVFERNRLIILTYTQVEPVACDCVSCTRRAAEDVWDQVLNENEVAEDE